LPAAALLSSSTSTPGISAVSLPGASPPAAAAASYRWKHIVAGVATLLAIILIAASRCSPSAPGGATYSAGPDERGERPTEIQVTAPRFEDGKAAKDWRKVVDKLRRQQFGEARRKLAEWERDHGETTETRNLASQLDALPAHVLRARDRGDDD
ncbi:MAG TPA: hypothetical protein VN253_13160, partial [Kofleriaceae bacterium]|nr:hypothetical protein [Kofleriaceae bacterium]